MPKQNPHKFNSLFHQKCTLLTKRWGLPFLKISYELFTRTPHNLTRLKPEVKDLGCTWTRVTTLETSLDVRHYQNTQDHSQREERARLHEAENSNAPRTPRDAERRQTFFFAKAASYFVIVGMNYCFFLNSGLPLARAPGSSSWTRPLTLPHSFPLRLRSLSIPYVPSLLRRDTFCGEVSRPFFFFLLAAAVELLTGCVSWQHPLKKFFFLKELGGQSMCIGASARTLVSKTNKNRQHSSGGKKTTYFQVQTRKVYFLWPERRVGNSLTRWRRESFFLFLCF